MPFFSKLPPMPGTTSTNCGFAQPPVANPAGFTAPQTQNGPRPDGRFKPGAAPRQSTHVMHGNREVQNHIALQSPQLVPLLAHMAQTNAIPQGLAQPAPWNAGAFTAQASNPFVRVSSESPQDIGHTSGPISRFAQRWLGMPGPAPKAYLVLNDQWIGADQAVKIPQIADFFRQTQQIGAAYNTTRPPGTPPPSSPPMQQQVHNPFAQPMPAQAFGNQQPMQPFQAWPTPQQAYPAQNFQPLGYSQPMQPWPNHRPAYPAYPQPAFQPFAHQQAFPPAQSWGYQRPQFNAFQPAPQWGGNPHYPAPQPFAMPGYGTQPPYFAPQSMPQWNAAPMQQRAWY